MVISTCEDALSEVCFFLSLFFFVRYFSPQMLIFNDDDTLLRVLDVLGKCMRQWDICRGLLVLTLHYFVCFCFLSSSLLQFPESHFATEFPTLDFSQCELNFRLCVEEINSSFPFSPNSKAC